tara:strand:+ start:35 stop:574 length:540 start_codon:yes stop_codon:yes gene_type:complete
MNYFIQFLTYLRIILSPFIFILIIFNLYGWALFVLFIASSSDFWDGYLARKFNLESQLGSILDPIADKILLTFLILSMSLAINSYFIGFVGGIMLIREFWVSALRDINSRQNNEEATQVTFLAKIKTFLQLFAFLLLLFGLYLNNPLIILFGNLMLFTALIVTIQTGLDYTVKTLKALK